MAEKRKIAVGVVFVLMIVTVLGVVGYYKYEDYYFASSEDAKVSGDTVRVIPQITAKILEVNFEEGTVVRKDEILVRQDMANQTVQDTTLGLVRAPEGGIVVKKQCEIGEITSPSQTVAVIMQPEKMYISANIEEKKIKYVKIGEKVELTLDSYPGEKFEGVVKSIGEVSNSFFSLFPSSTNGNFTKITQKVPVKIDFEKGDKKIMPGVNAYVKIRIR